MCQLRVRLLYADRREAWLNDIAAIQVAPDNITLSALFEPPRELSGFDIQHIDSLRNEVLLVQRSVENKTENTHDRYSLDEETQCAGAALDRT